MKIEENNERYRKQTMKLNIVVYFAFKSLNDYQITNLLITTFAF